jgi:hypothetical protein
MTRFFGSVIIWISYGVNDPEYNKSLIEKAEVMIKGFSEAALPGQFLVNVFPSLSYVPTWFPGTGWKKRLLHLAEETTNALVDTWNDAKERVVGVLVFAVGCYSDADDGDCRGTATRASILMSLLDLFKVSRMRIILSMLIRRSSQGIHPSSRMLVSGLPASRGTTWLTLRSPAGADTVRGPTHLFT